MNVDRNEKIWTLSNTGTKMHAFVQVWKDKDGNEHADHLRAMCRGTIARSADTRFMSRDETYAGVCPRCEKLAEAMWDRAEASMQPATEASMQPVTEASMQPATEAQDRGYVAPAGKFTDTQRDSMQDAFDAAVAVSQGVAVIEDDHADALKTNSKRANDPAPEFPAGTRVALSNGWHGTVLEEDRGVLSNILTNKRPQPYVRVAVDQQPGVGYHPATLLKVTSSLTNLDALHAEALEMDAAETPEPQRFHYRAVLATSGGTPLDGIEGYINAIDRDAAEDALKERYQTDLIRLTSLRINTA
jgi:hypothetical protein